MHRIDTSTAQRDKFGEGKNGFTRGNPQTGTPATQLDFLYCDAIQEEIANTIEYAGIKLDKSKHDQLATAIKELIGRSSVKLNSSTTSELETEAATSLAVKKVNDEVIITKNIANNAQEAAYASVKRSGDNMAGELQINGLRVLVDGDALPATKIVKDEVPLYEVGEHVVFSKRPRFNESELITKTDYTYQINGETVVLRRADGLIIQRFIGQFYGGHGTNGTIVTLPIAFPNNFYIALANDGAGGCHAVTAVPVSLSTVKIYGKNRGDYTDSLLQITVIGR